MRMNLNDLVVHMLEHFNGVSIYTKSGIEFLGSINCDGVVLGVKVVKTGSSISYDLPFAVFSRVNDPANLIQYTLLDLKKCLIQYVFGIVPEDITLH